MKFKYHYFTNQLSRIDPNNSDYSYQIPEERTFATQYGGRGFVLELPNHWITFTIKSNHLTVFYKKPLSNGEITYYKRDFAKADIISFEFSETDRVEKNKRGWWMKKEGG